MRFSMSIEQIVHEINDIEQTLTVKTNKVLAKTLTVVKSTYGTI